MPQLAPMWWTWMYLLFISSLHISTITMFNMNNPQPKSGVFFIQFFISFFLFNHC